MIFRALAFLLTGLSIFAQIPNLVAPVPNVQTVDNLSQMLARPAVSNVIYAVRGKSTAGDWGPIRMVRWDPTSVLATNTGTIFAVTNGGSGRWIIEWDGDPRVFGAKGDGVTDDTIALQNAFATSAAQGIPLKYYSSATNIVENLVLSSGSFMQPIIEGIKPFGAKQEYEAKTIWRLKSGAAASSYLFRAASGTPVTIRNMGFDGNKTNNPSVTNALIRLEGTEYDETLFENVMVINAPADAIYITRDETRFHELAVLYSGRYALNYFSTTDHQLLYALLGYGGDDGIHAESLFYSRFTEVDTFNNKGHGVFITNSINNRFVQLQSQDNWKSGMNVASHNLKVVQGNILRNNIDTNYHGANPYASGTYSEIEVAGASSTFDCTSCMIGEASTRAKYPKYLIDDLRPLSYTLQGVGIRLLFPDTRTNAGFVVARWPSHIERNSTIIANYDISNGEGFTTIPVRGLTVSGGYPYAIPRNANYVLALGTGRTFQLPATNTVPDGFRFTVIDAAGTALADPIALSVSGGGTIQGLSSYSLYENSGMWTFIKSGANYGIIDWSNTELLMRSDGSYTFPSRVNPRIGIITANDTGSAGIPMQFVGYGNAATDWNRLRFAGIGGTQASPTGMASNSAIGMLDFIARRADGTDSGTLAKIQVITESATATNNEASAILFATSDPDGSDNWIRFNSSGSVVIRDTDSSMSAQISSILELSSTNKAFLLPRLTTAWRNALTVADGMLLYNSTTARIQGYQAGSWVDFGVADGDKGDITVSSSGTVWDIDANSVALGTDTTGNYVATLETNGAPGLLITGSGTEAAPVYIGLDLEAGSNISISTNGNKLQISASTGGGSTNGTPVAVDGSAMSEANFSDGGDINFTASGTNVTGTVQANSVALSTDTTGVYVQTVQSVTGHLTASGNGSEGAVVTLTFASQVDMGTNTSFELPNAAAPTVNVFGQIAGDNDLWAASRGAPVFYDGTASVALVGALVSDTPSNGQVPKWNTGGTITWENDNTSAGVIMAVQGTNKTELNIIPSTSIIPLLSGTTNISFVISNTLTDGYYAGGFLPLYANVSNFLYGDLHYRQGNDIRSPMWETNTEWNAVGMRANNGIWSVASYNTNDFSVLETMIDIDPSAQSSATNTITIKNEGFNNLLFVEPNALFMGDVEMAANLTVDTLSVGTSNNLAASTAFVQQEANAKASYTMSWFTGAGDSPTDSTTYYGGGWDMAIGSSATYNLNKVQIPKTGVLRAVYYKARVAGTLGSSENVAHYIRINDTTDAALATVQYTAENSVGSATGLSQAVTAGDYVALKIVTPAWSTNPTSVRWATILYIE